MTMDDLGNVLYSHTLRVYVSWGGVLIMLRLRGLGMCEILAAGWQAPCLGRLGWLLLYSPLFLYFIPFIYACIHNQVIYTRTLT